MGGGDCSFMWIIVLSAVLLELLYAVSSVVFNVCVFWHVRTKLVCSMFVYVFNVCFCCVFFVIMLFL